jgi:hypothetical protein
MSPTIVYEGGYRIVIFPNDHPPAHVHIIKDDLDAKVQLDPIEFIEEPDFNPRQMKRILKLVREHQQELLDKWDEIHPEGR